MERPKRFGADMWGYTQVLLHARTDRFQFTGLDDGLSVTVGQALISRLVSA